MLGMSFDRLARHMRPYLEVLVPLLYGQPAETDGDQYRVAADLNVPGGTPVSCITASLGPAMLKLTGELADGTTLWMTGPKTIESHIASGLRVGTEAAGCPDACLICTVPALITDDAGAGCARAAQQFVAYSVSPPIAACSIARTPKVPPTSP